MSLPEEIEEAIRRVAAERFGGGKGSIAMAIAEAVREKYLVPEEEALKWRMLDRLKRGWDMGGRTYKSRDELYDRFDRKR